MKAGIVVSGFAGAALVATPQLLSAQAFEEAALFIELNETDHDLGLKIAAGGGFEVE